MILDIDLTGGAPAVELLEPEDCKRFHVAVRGGDTAAVGDVLESRDLGVLLASGDAMVATAAVRRMAQGRVAAGWDGDFAAMLEYARTKGWLDESGAMIRAHVEWSRRPAPRRPGAADTEKALGLQVAKLFGVSPRLLMTPPSSGSGRSDPDHGR